MSPEIATAAKSFQVGQFVCYPIPDGEFVYPRMAMLPPDIDPAEASHFPEQLTVPYTPLLVDAGGRRILIDTGAGPLAPSTGRLIASLAQSGFRPDEIDFVVLSHAHADHIGGLLAEEGTLMLPNARILMSRREYDLWTSSELRNRLGSGGVYGSAEIENIIRMWVDRYLAPLRDRFEWVDNESEVVPGVSVFSAGGHTPAHLGLAITSGSETLLYTGDAFSMPEHIANPEWTASFDLDREQTVATRLRLLDQAATDHSSVYHYHFAHVGKVVRHGAGFAWESAQ